MSDSRYDLAPPGKFERAIMDLSLDQVLRLAVVDAENAAAMTDFQRWIDDPDLESFIPTPVVGRKVA